MNIKMLLSFKNYVIIKDELTNYIWLYSYNEPLLYYDGTIHIVKKEPTITNKKHKNIFEKWLTNLK